MDVRELFDANLRLIDRVARSVCERNRLAREDAEDFVSAARLALLADDYAVLRKFEQRSSLASFLAVVFEHLLLDQRVQAAGRWHPSRAAERMGPAAVLLERLVRRDERAIDEVLPLVRAIDPSLTRASLETMLAQMPERAPRPRMVPIENEQGPLPVAAPERADARTDDREAGALASQISTVVRRTIESWPREDRMLFRFHFGRMMSIADIARMMRLPQRPLYRRLEGLLRSLRMAVAEEGFEARVLNELIGRDPDIFDFGLRESEDDRPSLSEAAEGYP